MLNEQLVVKYVYNKLPNIWYKVFFLLEIQMTKKLVLSSKGKNDNIGGQIIADARRIWYTNFVLLD